jgi:hypothetical protein
MADKMDLFERLAALDSLQVVRRYGAGGLRFLSGQDKEWVPVPREPWEKLLEETDWAPALQNVNRWYDRLAATLRVKDRRLREKLLDLMEKDLKGLKKEATGLGGMAGLLLGGDVGKTVGKRISNIMIGLMTPAFRKVQNAADRSEQVQANLHVAFALAAYRSDRGGYPAKLDELAPKYLTAVADDLFSGKPLIYRPAKDGYLLYSVGENGKDDGGQWFGDDPPGDDPRVRLPLPELKPKK